MTDMPKDWRGILPSLPTPFTETGSIDHEALRRVVDFVADSGAVGIVCMGLAGEVEALGAAEREEIVSTVVGRLTADCRSWRAQQLRIS